MRTRTSIRKNESAATTDTATTAAPAAAATTDPATTAPTTDPATAAPVADPAAATGNPTDPAATGSATPNPSMDELAARVAEAEKNLASNVPTEKSYTQTEFASYVAEQLDLAKAEDMEKAAARLKALQDTIAKAKTAFESSSTASLPVYHDPWQTLPTTKNISSPTGVSSGTSNVGYPTNVDTAKRMLVIAKELRTADSPLAKALDAKVAKSTDFTPVAKAGDAAAMLEKIASLFGVSATTESGQYRGLGWRVEDVICALESAARVDAAMTTLGAAFGGLGDGAPAPAPAAAAPGAQPTTQAADPTAKSSVAKAAGDNDDFSIRVGAIENADGWPVDMNSAPRVAKAEKSVAGEITF